MPELIQPSSQSDLEDVDILLIGHVTRDLLGQTPEEYRQGGTVSFAAAASRGLGRRPTLITRAATPEHLAELPDDVEVLLLPSPTTTTFANIYTEEGRIQYCYTPAAPITADDIPDSLRQPNAVLLGPLVQEIGPDVAAIFPDETLVVAVPQGWMRIWDETGRVTHGPWADADKVLPHVDVLILSLEDINEDLTRLDPWFEYTPLIVVTEYRDGSTIYRRQANGRIESIKVPPRPAKEVDPTGAGDIFATAFMIRLQETSDPVESARFANVAASISVEYVGISGVPTRQEVLDYMAEHPF